MAVTVPWPLRRAELRRIDPRLTIWLAALALLSASNVGIWAWMARSAAPYTPYAHTQLVLSGIYVAICGFRSLFPRVDLERVCLWDTWLSGVMLGRAAATVAELCVALQCSLLVERLSEITGAPLSGPALAFVPLAAVAEAACWYAVLSLNHIGHAFEESLWAVLMLLLSVALWTAAAATDGPLHRLLLAGALTYGVGGLLTLAFDVRMYLRRWRLHTPGRCLTLAAVFHDTRHRRVPTRSWNVWREKVPWMTLYFSLGVWTSLGMVLLESVARR